MEQTDTTAYTKLSITNWAAEDRPREKLMAHGNSALSNAELIAILIGSGNRDESAVQLSQRILDSVENNLNELGRRTITDFTAHFKGIGDAKAISILAALELGRRRKIADILQRQAITSPDDAAEIFIAQIGDLPHEEFWVLLLNQSNKILRKEKISQGGIAETPVDLRLLMKKVLDSQSTAIIVSHNHPSGNLTPSASDRQLTEKIKQACSFFDIRLLDHLVIANNQYFSFSNEGLLE